jgi:hypothetical protein
MWYPAVSYLNHMFSLEHTTTRRVRAIYVAISFLNCGIYTIVTVYSFDPLNRNLQYIYRAKISQFQPCMQWELFAELVNHWMARCKPKYSDTTDMASSWRRSRWRYCRSLAACCGAPPGGSLLLQHPFDHRCRRVAAGRHNVLHTSSPEELID